ncbi:MAG: metallophosphoesterase [Pirellulales bacterium]
MPVTLQPFDRRHFLRASFAAGALCFGPRTLRAADGGSPIDPDRFVLFSDTHVWAKRDELVREVNMAKNLQQACREALAGEKRPAQVLVCGDCAYLTGEADDYAVLVELLQPLREAQVPVHLVLGNHDHRERFRAALPSDGAGEKAGLAERHVTIVRAPRANWFLLDSLDVTNKTPGVLGDAQRQWLARALDAHADRPALVMVHHNLDERPTPSGLVDTPALLELLVPRKHVKALFYGHSHQWAVSQRDGLHVVNLPPTAYVFDKKLPNGWVDAQAADDRLTLQLHCLDAAHPRQGEMHELRWRAG